MIEAVRRRSGLGMTMGRRHVDGISAVVRIVTRPRATVPLRTGAHGQEEPLEEEQARKDEARVTTATAREHAQR